ncbi:deoxynucleoside kinase isoform X1 [Anopheles arabiensis]|uniref:Deoxynucleoside kinase domain-containing protein n=1 Tax=Anopheles arabiensis TaxID=7173 RepID=A0A499FPR5_ANOAR|nr:deoxynucleoside kinase isoform X1 [Anopheles arabiensis]
MLLKTVRLMLRPAKSIGCSQLGRRNIHNMPPIASEKLGASGKKPFTVFVEGNIGSGKTTFLNHFQKFNDICLLTEPVEKWRNCGGVNLLDLMYKESHRWAMPFQTYVTLTMLDMHTCQTDKSVKLMERSLFSARNCFVESMLASGSLHQGMYNVLQEWYDFICCNIHIQADLIVYLQTSPEVVYERMKQRARSEESCVPLEYLKELHELHENWLIHGASPRPAPVLVLNADLDLNTIGAEYERSETSILKPILIENTNQHAILTSPAKRAKTDF